MDPQDFSVTFRIRHPSIDPAELSRQLGIEPQHAWRAGEPRRLESGEVGSGVYRETFWVGLLPAPLALVRDAARAAARPRGPLIAAVKTGPVLPQITLYFTLLKMKRAAAFWRAFTDQGGTVECRLQVHKTDGFQLEMSQALMLMLVELKVALSIEVDGAQRGRTRGLSRRRARRAEPSDEADRAPHHRDTEPEKDRHTARRASRRPRTRSRRGATRTAGAR